MSQAAPFARFALARWAAWSPSRPDAAAWRAWAVDGVDGDGIHTPAVAGMAPMLRRRLGAYGRMALECAFGLGPNSGQPIVFVSRHGEMGRCLALLTELRETGGVSPQGFSVAVHNAVAGLYTIDQKVNAPVSALSAGADGFAAGLVEAGALLADGADEVWLLLCEEPLPAAFAPHADEPQAAYAIGLALRAGDEWQLLAADAGEADASEVPALQALRALLRGQAAHIRTASRSWRLQPGTAA